MIRNLSGQFFHVICFDDNGRVTGMAGILSASLSIDSGAYGPLADTTPVELGTTGEYVFALLQAETNGHECAFIPLVDNINVQVLGVPSNVIYTSPMVSDIADGVLRRSVCAARSNNDPALDPVDEPSLLWQVSLMLGTSISAEDVNGDRYIYIPDPCSCGEEFLGRLLAGIDACGNLTSLSWPDGCSSASGVAFAAVPYPYHLGLRELGASDSDPCPPDSCLRVEIVQTACNRSLCGCSVDECTAGCGCGTTRDLYFKSGDPIAFEVNRITTTDGCVCPETPQVTVATLSFKPCSGPKSETIEVDVEYVGENRVKANLATLMPGANYVGRLAIDMDDACYGEECVVETFTIHIS
jgi:hypothetical protein